MSENNPTEIYGLIGYPVKHSFSSPMHNAAFKHLGINAEYRLFEVKPEQLEDFLLRDVPVKDTEGRSCSSKDIFGFNITIPHKVKAKEILEKEFPFDKDARSMLRDLHYVNIIGSGAVNTVRRIDNKLLFFNTDAPGFLKSLEEDLKFVTIDKSVLVLGCGGAGRAVIAALSWKQHKVSNIYIYDISNTAIESAKEHFQQFGYIRDRLEFITKEKQMQEVIKDCQLLVNASPVGMKEQDNPVIDKNLLHKDLSVYDVIYNRKTQLIKDAESKGLQARGGEGMLLYQGVAALEYWLNKKISEDTIKVMRGALDKELEKCQT